MADTIMKLSRRSMDAEATLIRNGNNIDSRNAAVAAADKLLFPQT